MSRKPRKLILATLMIKEWKTLETLAEFDLQGDQPSEGRHFGCLVVQLMLIERILEAQRKDEGLRKWFDKVSAKDPEEWNIGVDGGHRCHNRLYV